MMSWLQRLFGRRKLHRDLSEEIRAHLDEKIEELVASGMPREEAGHAARRAFGNVLLAEQDAREVWSWPALDNFLMDVRYSLRMLRKSPGFTAVAILTLALGIGANTAIFSLINAVMLRTLPVPNPQQLVQLGWGARGRPNFGSSSSYGSCPFATPDSQPGSCSFSYPLFDQLRAEQKSFSGLFGYAAAGWYVFVSGNFFNTLEVRPALGRLLTPADDAPGAPAAAVISHQFWQRHYGGSPSVVGKTLAIGKSAYTIVGVASPRFTGIEPGSIPDVWLPLSPSFGTDIGFPKERQTDPQDTWLELMARLGPGVSIARAQALTNAMFVRDVTTGSQALFKPNAKPRLLLTSFARGSDNLRLEYSQTLVLLLIVTGIVLLLACANIAGLALARSAARQKEVAVRLALGTTRWRLIRQLLTESLLLAGIGGILGILLAYWGASSLVAFLSAHTEPILIDVHPDLRVLGFLVLVSAVVGILAGLAPAIRATRVDLAPALKEASTAQAGEKRSWHRLGLGSGLVVAQVALSILVLAAAGLFVRSLLNQESGHAGFQTRNILTIPLSSNGGTFFMGPAPADPQRVALLSQLRERISSLPGVVSATYASDPPMSGDFGWVSYTVDGQPPKPGSRLQVSSFAVGPDFFEALEIPIVEGEGFTAADFNSDAKIVPIIVNRGLVKQAFAKENPLGHRLVFNGTHGRIVGVVPDVSYDSPPDGSPLRPRLYYPLTGGPAFFEIRTSRDPKALIPEIRELVSQSNVGLQMTVATTVSDEIAKLLYQQRLIGWLSSLFALLALLLACIGLYGLLAWEVVRRTREIGIRMALGAERAAVLRMVLRRGVDLAVAGTAAGIGLAFAFTRLLGHFLFAVSATDPLSFAAVACLLLLTALAACYFPARRAMRVDTMAALRNE